MGPDHDAVYGEAPNADHVPIFRIWSALGDSLLSTNYVLKISAYRTARITSRDNWAGVYRGLSVFVNAGK